MSINTCALSGNLTRDAELRTTTGGTYICNFTVAVNERNKNQQTGEYEDRPNFIDCVLFGRRGEVLANMLHKGTKVMLSGRLRWSSWEKDGQRKSKIEVVVEEIDIARTQATQSASAPDYGYPAASVPQQTVSTATEPDAGLYATDIPF